MLSSAGLHAPEEGLSRGVGRRVRLGKGRVRRVLSCKEGLEISYHPNRLCPLQSAATQMPLPSLSSLECCVPPGMACSWTGSNRSTRRKRERQVRHGLQRIREPGGERTSLTSMPIFSFLLNPFVLASIHLCVHPSLHPSVHPFIHHPLASSHRVSVVWQPQFQVQQWTRQI